jgi:hypothetical protein
MATIVQHKPTGLRYVLIGTGLGGAKAISPGFLGGNLFVRDKGQEIPAAAVCDAQGNITWFYTKELQVLEVDGVRIGDYFLKGQAAYSVRPGNASPIHDEICPACQFRVSAITRECPACGITLMSDENT